MRKIKDSYIDTVVFRVDFDKIDILSNDEFPIELRDNIKRNFPMSSTRNVQANNVQLGPSGDILSVSSEASKEWSFTSTSGGKKIVVGHSALIFECNKSEYSTYPNEMEKFGNVIDAFYQSLGEVKTSRIGMRYINIVKSENPMKWDGLINEKYIPCIVNENGKEYMRALSLLESITVGKFKTRLQYGLANKDYPASIVAPEFLIDVDVYDEGIFFQNEIVEKLGTFHYHVEQTVADVLDESLSEEIKGD